MSERRFDASLAHRLDMPEREIWLPPGEVIAALQMTPGDAVADIGAGTGYFTLPLAKDLGAGGKVYAVDSQEKMLEILRAKLNSPLERIVDLVHAEADVTFLPSAICDLVFLANVWHEFADRQTVLREAKRILKNRGRIAVLDWRPDVEPEHGPPLSHRLSADSASLELLSAGFEQISARNVGKYSWMVQAVGSSKGCRDCAENDDTDD